MTAQVNPAILQALGLDPKASLEEVAARIEKLQTASKRTPTWSPQIDSSGRILLYRTSIRFFAEDVERLKEVLASDEMADIVKNGDCVTRADYIAMRKAVAEAK